MIKPTFLLATNNQHKKQELQQIMKNISLVTPGELGIEFDCDETGSTFLENSMLKAQTLFKLTGKPVIADDSGLCVDGLDGAPGIYSSRYGSNGGPELESPERNNYLLSNMKALKGAEKRSAAFVCCMSAIIDEYRCYSVQERMRGYITDEPFGAGGFGYDPVFFLPQYNKTVAELSDAEKNAVSHRGQAAARLDLLLKDCIGETNEQDT